MASCPSFVPWDPNRADFDIDKAPWELYKIDEDFSQANDLAAQYPDKLRELQDLWWAEAAKYSVLPLDWRGAIRMNAELMGRPSLIRGRTKMTYYPGTIGLPDAASPPMCNKSWTITAEIELLDDKTQGMIVTHGGLEGGYGLYLRDGKPTFVYNFLSVERFTFAAKSPLPKGKSTLVVDFKYDGGGMGKGGSLTMSANGKTVAEGRLEKSIPIQMSARRRTRHRQGRRLARGLYLHAAVRVHRANREGVDRTWRSGVGKKPAAAAAECPRAGDSWSLRRLKARDPCAASADAG